MRSSTRSQVARIPREIYEQEGEIESMFHNLVRFGRIDYIRNNEFVIWILATVLGFLSGGALYLLWLKTNAN
jgi:hypothetical protein